MKKLKALMQSISDAIFAFDQTVLDYLEGLCHKLQRLTGLSHYFWLKLDAIVFAAGFSAFIYPIVPSEERWKALFVIGCLLCAGCIGYGIWERMSYRRMAKGHANPLRKEFLMVGIRCINGYLFIAGMLLIAVVSTLFLTYKEGLLSLCIILIWVPVKMLYILPACDPLPPTRGKIREWLSKVLLRTSTEQI